MGLKTSKVMSPTTSMIPLVTKVSLHLVIRIHKMKRMFHLSFFSFCEKDNAIDHLEQGVEYLSFGTDGI